MSTCKPSMPPIRSKALLGESTSWDPVAVVSKRRIAMLRAVEALVPDSQQENRLVKEWLRCIYQPRWIRGPTQSLSSRCRDCPVGSGEGCTTRVSSKWGRLPISSFVMESSWQRSRRHERSRPCHGLLMCHGVGSAAVHPRRSSPSRV